jgi:hypothetical protein
MNSSGYCAPDCTGKIVCFAYGSVNSCFIAGELPEVEADAPAAAELPTAELAAPTLSGDAPTVEGPEGTPDVPAVEGSLPKGDVSAALPDASAPTGDDAEVAGTSEPLEGEGKKKKKSRFGLPSFFSSSSKKKTADAESSSSSDAEQSQALPEVPAAPAVDVDTAAGDVPAVDAPATDALAVEGSVPKGDVSAALPDASTSAPTGEDAEALGASPEGEEKEKKSRFGLPSFLTPGGKKESKTGMPCRFMNCPLYQLIHQVIDCWMAVKGWSAFKSLT